ncbi:MAG: 50S ribosome-binding GTPase [Deltaproteobacteria bacterium]|jgi:GTP-binding protein Era|nr:50S ribosome-binding GTPase [Deltaproteobacteria bacterium]
MEKDLNLPQGEHKSGYVAIFGAPNSGKSTLLNHLLAEKVAAVAAKPQTTRHRVLGIVTEPGYQLIFWDTPGYHHSERLLNQGMVSRAKAALAESDISLWLVDGAFQGEAHDLCEELAKQTL